MKITPHLEYSLLQNKSKVLNTFNSSEGKFYSIIGVKNTLKMEFKCRSKNYSQNRVNWYPFFFYSLFGVVSTP